LSYRCVSPLQSRGRGFPLSGRGRELTNNVLVEEATGRVSRDETLVD